MKAMKPVRMSLTRQVLSVMESYLQEGHWAVGDRIPPEPELAKAFSVSHNTVREALQSLIHAGILEARLALEKEIARLAATNHRKEDLLLLEKTLAKCHERNGTGIEDDMNFHAAVATATHNPVLAQLYSVIINYLRENLEALLEEKQYEDSAMQLHADLLDAIRSHDADAAEAIIIKIVDFDTVSIRDNQKK